MFLKTLKNVGRAMLNYSVPATTGLTLVISIALFTDNPSLESALEVSVGMSLLALAWRDRFAIA